MNISASTLSICACTCVACTLAYCFTCIAHALPLVLQELASITEEGERAAAEKRVKSRTLGTVRLIAELYRKEVVKEAIIVVCLRELLEVSKQQQQQHLLLQAAPLLSGHLSAVAHLRPRTLMCVETMTAAALQWGREGVSRGYFKGGW